MRSLPKLTDGSKLNIEECQDVDDFSCYAPVFVQFPPGELSIVIYADGHPLSVFPV
jgi:hypothetical protein